MPDPVAGEVVNGYRFRGGNPRDRSSWEPVGGASSAGQPPAGLTRLRDGSLITGQGPNGGAPKRIAGLSVQEQAQLGRIRGTAATQRTDLADSERFARLQQEQGTGGFYGLPLIGDMASGVAAAFDPEVDEMREISARLTPQQRPAGSGATSDFEQRLYGRSVPGVNRTREGNEATINRGRSRAGESQRRAEFFDWYASQNGTLQGAEQAWNTIYQPPPVRPGTPEPRASVRPTEAQRAWVERANRSGQRDRTATLGTRQNPRVPPEGFDISSFPAGDWYVAPDGRLAQAGRDRAAGQMRARSGRTGIASIRRVP